MNGRRTAVTHHGRGLVRSEFLQVNVLDEVWERRASEVEGHPDGSEIVLTLTDGRRSCVCTDTRAC